MACLYFLFLSDSVLESCNFLIICLFLLGCPFYWQQSLMILFISAVCYNFSSFIFNFIDLNSLLLHFLDDFINFVSQKNQLLVSLNFEIYFFLPISFIDALDFMISFLLLAFGFVCSSFSSWFSCKVMLFTWDIFSSGRVKWVWTSFLELLLLHPTNLGSLYVHCHLFLWVFNFLFGFFSNVLIV